MDYVKLGWVDKGATGGGWQGRDSKHKNQTGSSRQDLAGTVWKDRMRMITFCGSSNPTIQRLQPVIPCVSCHHLLLPNERTEPPKRGLYPQVPLPPSLLFQPQEVRACQLGEEAHTTNKEMSTVSPAAPRLTSVSVWAQTERETRKSYWWHQTY